MTTFIPVNYHKRKYPPNIISPIEELAANFGKTDIPFCERYSLHTEYSFTKRALPNSFSEKYPTLSSSNYRGIPLLWTGREWAIEFTRFIKDITNGRPFPEIVEIHPPFISVCKTIDEFLDLYDIFEKEMKMHFPNTTICIENRSGSQYNKSRFLISTLDDVEKLLTAISNRKSNLRIALDYPQLFTAYQKDPKDVPMDWFEREHDKIEPHKSLISSIHLWGKTRNPKGRLVAHIGDLNTLFDTDIEKKNRLLQLIKKFYNDDICRYFVPEVNSSDQDLQSIVEDCIDAGILFSGEYYLQ